MERINRLLLIGYDCLPKSEKVATIEEIKTRCIQIFSNHIGRDNPITPVELFEAIFDAPKKVSVYEKAYLWNNVIRRALSELRSQGKCFVRNAGQNLYVIQTQEEAEKFKSRLEQNIKNSKVLQEKVDNWVKKKKWKELVKAK